MSRALLIATSFAATAVTSCSGGRDGDRLQDSSPTSLQLGLADRDNSAASVAAAGREVVVAWGAAASNTPVEIYVAKSVDGGRTFAAPVRVDDGVGQPRASGEQAPRVAIGGGTVAVLWTAKREGMTEVRVAQSADGGRTFGPSRAVHRAGLSGLRGWGSIARGADGDLHVAWLDGRHAAGPTPASAGAHVHGATHAPMRQDLYYARLGHDGTVAERPIATDVCFCCKTAVLPVDDLVVMAWRHIFPGSIRDIALASISRASPIDPVRVSADGWKIDACPDDGPAVAMDAGKWLHVVWPSVLDTASGARAVFYASSADGRSFSPRHRIDDPAGGAAGHPHIASGGQRVAVVWDQAAGGTRRVYMITRAPDGGWSAPSALSGDEPASYATAAASDGGFIVAWTTHVAGRSTIAVTRRPY